MRCLIDHLRFHFTRRKSLVPRDRLYAYSLRRRSHPHAIGGPFVITLFPRTPDPCLSVRTRGKSNCGLKPAKQATERGTPDRHAMFDGIGFMSQVRTSGEDCFTSRTIFMASPKLMDKVAL